MIAKVSQGKTFKGALQYALKSEKEPELIAGNMYSVTAEDLTREFVRNVANSRIKNKMWFSSLSLSDQDKKLSSDDWGKIAKRYAEEMGFGNAPYVAVRHYDTGHPHIHLIASRVDFNGKTVPDGREYKRAEAFCRKIEKEMGLIRVPSSDDKEFSVGRKRSLKELNKGIRTEEASIRVDLQTRIDDALHLSKSVTDFIEHLQEDGIQPIFNLQSTGRVSGISYQKMDSGEIMKGSSLGKAYSFSGIQKDTKKRKGVSYEKERDGGSISTCRSAISTGIETSLREIGRDDSNGRLLSQRLAGAEKISSPNGEVSEQLQKYDGYVHQQAGENREKSGEHSQISRSETLHLRRTGSRDSSDDSVTLCDSSLHILDKLHHSSKKMVISKLRAKEEMKRVAKEQRQARERASEESRRAAQGYALKLQREKEEAEKQKQEALEKEKQVDIQKRKDLEKSKSSQKLEESVVKSSPEKRKEEPQQENRLAEQYVREQKPKIDEPSKPLPKSEDTSEKRPPTKGFRRSSGGMEL